MEIEQQIEHLIILNGFFITIEGKKELIELNLCTYDINKKQVSSESSYYIKPLIPLTSDVILSNVLDNEKLAKAINLQSLVITIRQFFEANYIAKDLLFGIIYQDETLMSIFEDIVPSQNERSFNIFSEYKLFYSQIPKSLDDMISILKLKQTEPNTPSLRELNTMVRIINKMIKDGKRFSFVSSQKVVFHHQTFLDNDNMNDNPAITESVQDNTPNYLRTFYLRFKGLPITVNKQEIINLLYLHEVTENNIVISYDIFGRKTGDVVIRTSHEGNHRELLSNYKYYLYKENIIDVIETNENDYLSCMKSEVYVRRDSLYKSNGNGYKKVFLRMSKIPYSAREEDIKIFFKNYTIAENGIRLNRYRKGNSTGEAVIAFITEEECHDVLQRENGRILMNQIITLEESSLDQYEDYSTSSAFSNWIKILSEHIQSDDVQRSLFISNLPLDITKEDFLEIIQVFNINESNLIIDDKLLTENGSLIVKFFSEEEADQAKSYLTKESLKWKNRAKKLNVENLLFVVNKGNEN